MSVLKTSRKMSSDSLLKDSFLNAETYPAPCQTFKMEFFHEYSPSKAGSR